MRLAGHLRAALQVYLSTRSVHAHLQPSAATSFKEAGSMAYLTYARPDQVRVKQGSALPCTL
jgi:hypothetical protein